MIASHRIDLALSAFLTRADTFCGRAGWSEGKLSRALFADPTRIPAIRATNSDVGVKRLALADAKLAELAAAAGITLPGEDAGGQPARASGELPASDARHTHLPRPQGTLRTRPFSRKDARAEPRDV